MNGKDWGVVFIKTLRLWEKVFKETSFLSKRVISDNFPGLLFQMEENINDLPSDELLNDTKSCFNQLNNSLHINIIPEEIFSDVFLCEDIEGSFYDPNTDSCIYFTDITQIKDKNITIDKVQVSYNHNYGIAFWVLFENMDDLSNGFSVNWTNHMNIAFQKQPDRFYAYCFPQNYPPYSNNFENKTPKDIHDILLNKANATYDDLSGQWIWVTCFVSYYNKKFDLQGEEYTLEPEFMYDNYTTDHPFGYFFHEDEKDNSSLIISYNNQNAEGNGPATSKIYLRVLYLFNDYLPSTYVESIKYMNLGVVNYGEFPALNMLINFRDYEIFTDTNTNTKQMKLNYSK